MVLTETVIVKWSNRCRKYYEGKGYVYTRVNTPFVVKIEDLNPTSAEMVSVKCEKCGKERKCRYYCAIAGLETGNICRQCVQPQVMKSGIETWLRKNGTFLDFCKEEIGDDFVEKYWSDKNEISPDSLTRTSYEKIWIKCQNKDYHDDYQTSCAHFSRGDRCPQCRRGIHRRDSLGGMIDEIYGEGEANLRWSDKNTDSPYSISPTSHGKAWFKCPSGAHKDYSQSITNAARSQYDCPMCARESHKSRLQIKVEKYISDEYAFPMAFEWDCSLRPKNPKSGYVMPYDIEIVGKMILIEVNGVQHYKESSFHLKSGETKQDKLSKQMERDQFKKQYAISHGYTLIEVPYWTEKDGSYKQLIDAAVALAQKAASA